MSIEAITTNLNMSKSSSETLQIQAQQEQLLKLNKVNIVYNFIVHILGIRLARRCCKDKPTNGYHGKF